MTVTTSPFTVCALRFHRPGGYRREWSPKNVFRHANSPYGTEGLAVGFSLRKCGTRALSEVPQARAVCRFGGIEAGCRTLIATRQSALSPPHQLQGQPCVRRVVRYLQIELLLAKAGRSVILWVLSPAGESKAIDLIPSW